MRPWKKTLRPRKTRPRTPKIPQKALLGSKDSKRLQNPENGAKEAFFDVLPTTPHKRLKKGQNPVGKQPFFALSPKHAQFCKHHAFSRNFDGKKDHGRKRRSAWIPATFFHGNDHGGRPDSFLHMDGSGTHQPIQPPRRNAQTAHKHTDNTNRRNQRIRGGPARNLNPHNPRTFIERRSWRNASPRRCPSIGKQPLDAHF